MSLRGFLYPQVFSPDTGEDLFSAVSHNDTITQVLTYQRSAAPFTPLIATTSEDGTARVGLKPNSLTVLTVMNAVAGWSEMR
jgi:hypothetical protein